MPSLSMSTFRISWPRSWGSYLVHDEASGVPKIRRIILEDIEAAEQRGDKEHVLVLKLALKHFVDTHPSASGSPA